MAPRRRKHNPTIPAHIDQSKLPAGIYWDASGKGRWYVFVDKDGRKGTERMAGPDATLSDLHGIMEARTTGTAKGTVEHVVSRYKSSPAWRKLSPRSQHDYAYALNQAMAYKTAQGPLGSLLVDRLSPPVFARLRDKIAATHPAKANVWLRRLKSAFAWGVQDGCCKTNPCSGVSSATEEGKDGMPTLPVMRAVQAFARERGERLRTDRGHLAPYLAPFIEIAYQCRLRSIEVLSLTDASITPDGLLGKRTKGSRDSVTRIDGGLQAALQALQAYRAKVWEGKASPMLPAARPLFVAERGSQLTRNGFSIAWQRMMREAIEAEVITEADRFTAHGLKHRGITDSDDKRSGGHKSETMRQRYDKEIPVFDGPNPGRGTSGIRE